MSAHGKSAIAIIAGVLAAGLTPAEPITPAAWAGKNLIVADGPRAGSPFDLSLTPYLIEPLNFWSDETRGNKGVFKKSKQVGGTEMAIAAIGYTAVVEPCDVMLVEPTQDNLTEMIALKLGPTIERSPALAEKVLPQTSRSGRGSTASIKRFRSGGSLLAGIATSTAFLRGKTRKKIIRDEASEYDDDLAGQGSPHDMITGAYETFRADGDWKDLWISTPTIKGACHITKEFEDGDQRYWHVPCPGCGGEFVFRFDRSYFKFEDVAPHKTHYIAPCCGTVIEHFQKNELVRKGRWIATAPETGKHASWHFDTLSSPFVPWDDIAARAVAVGDDPAKAKTFDTLTLGVAHEIKGDAPDHERLMALRENYDRRRIPRNGLILVGSADVQGNAIYVLITAYAPDRQSWIVEALVLDGDTADPNGGAFAKLNEVYETDWPDSFGGTRRVDAFGVDSGFRAHVVYTWCRSRPGAFALKGGEGWSRAALSTPSLVDVDFGGKRVKQGAAVWTVGGWSLKAQLYADLRKQRVAEGATAEPAGACHFGTWVEENVFRQITAEYLTDEHYRGRTRRVWKERGPNHFLDCMVYGRALADYLGLSRMTSDEWIELARLRCGSAVGADLFSPAPIRIIESAAAPPSVPSDAGVVESTPFVRRSSQSPFMS